MRVSHFKYMVGLTLVILIVVGLALHFLFDKPMRYEFPMGFKGWSIVQFENSNCPPLPSQGLFLIVSVPASGKACTSTRHPDRLVYYQFAYVDPSGNRQRLSWNHHGKAGTQVWLIGYDLGSRSEENFVGDEWSMNHSGSPPKLY
jgi:hypothetical protein